MVLALAGSEGSSHGMSLEDGWLVAGSLSGRSSVRMGPVRSNELRCVAAGITVHGKEGS